MNMKSDRIVLFLRFIKLLFVVVKECVIILRFHLYFDPF